MLLESVSGIKSEHFVPWCFAAVGLRIIPPHVFDPTIDGLILLGRKIAVVGQAHIRGAVADYMMSTLGKLMVSKMAL